MMKMFTGLRAIPTYKTMSRLNKLIADFKRHPQNMGSLTDTQNNKKCITQPSFTAKFDDAILINFVGVDAIFYCTK